MDQFYMMTNKNIIRALGLPSLLNPNFLFYSNAEKSFLQGIFSTFYNLLQNRANEMTYLAALSVKLYAENIKR
jgi:hypothetical protein